MIRFDGYLFVDWSAASGRGPKKPRADALWVGEGLWSRDGALGQWETYWRTRDECVGYVREQLLQAVKQGLRLLVGFDFPYGYPQGFAQALGLSGHEAAWRQVWACIAGEVQDDGENRNQRFAAAAQLNARCGSGPGPFWACPLGAASAQLASTSPGFPFTTDGGVTLQRLRLTEGAARRKNANIQEVWKLYASGSVGGQALTGIPRLLQLRDDPALRAYSKVWPFETGFTHLPAPEHGPFILHAEIWPSLGKPEIAPGEIKDQAQVRALVKWAAAQDASGTLASCFDRPAGLTSEALATCVDQEGWILGC